MSKSQKITPWRNMIGAALLIMASLGINSGGMTRFYLPVTQELGFSQAQFSMYFTLTMLVCGVTMLFSGRFLIRYREKFRLIALVTLLGNGIFIFCYSLCSKLWQFYLLSILRGVCFAFGGGVSATMVINDWFEDKRPLATSVVFAGSSIGGMAFTRLSNYIIGLWHWRTAYMVLGGIVVVLAVVVALLLTQTPGRMQLQPYRDGKPKKTSRLDPNSGYMRGEALKMPVFWIFMVGVFLLNIAALSVMQNVISSLMKDKGYTDLAATNIFTVLQVCNACGGLLAGVLLDKIGFGKVVSVYLLLQILAMVCMFRAEYTVLAVAFAAMFGFCNNVCSSVTSGLTSEIFGLKDYGSIYGILGLPLMLGMAIGPLIAGTLVDATGHYTVIWAMGIVLVLLVMPCYLVPYYLRKKGKLKPPASDLVRQED